MSQEFEALAMESPEAIDQRSILLLLFALNSGELGAERSLLILGRSFSAAIPLLSVVANMALLAVVLKRSEAVPHNNDQK